MTIAEALAAVTEKYQPAVRILELCEQISSDLPHKEVLEALDGPAAETLLSALESLKSAPNLNSKEARVAITTLQTIATQFDQAIRAQMQKSLGSTGN